MKQIIKLITRILRQKRSVEQITRPLTSIMSNLDAFEAEQKKRAEAERKRAEARLQAAAQAEGAAGQASKAREKFAAIFAD